MRVKIGSKWYSSDDQDICIEFTEKELEYVKTESFDPEVAPKRRFAVMHEDGRTTDQMREWIRECDEEII